MVEVIGLDAALEVIKRWGGAPLYIPMRLAIDNHIVQAIGLDAARKLAWHYRADERRGGVILVPLATQALRRLRAERIMQALENESVTRVARRFGTTDRHIRRIKKAYGAVAADERQGELF